jgi:hypothetical protein
MEFVHLVTTIISLQHCVGDYWMDLELLGQCENRSSLKRTMFSAG